MVETKLEKCAYQIKLGDLWQLNRYKKQQPLRNDQRPLMIPFSISSQPKWDVYFELKFFLTRSALIFDILLFYLQFQEAKRG